MQENDISPRSSTQRGPCSGIHSIDRQTGWQMESPQGSTTTSGRKMHMCALQFWRAAAGALHLSGKQHPLAASLCLEHSICLATASAAAWGTGRSTRSCSPAQRRSRSTRCWSTSQDRRGCRCSHTCARLGQIHDLAEGAESMSDRTSAAWVIVSQASANGEAGGAPWQNAKRNRRFGGHMVGHNRCILAA